MALLVKNLPAMGETCVQSLGWEDPLEKGKKYSGLKNSMDCIAHGIAKNQTQLSGFHLLEVIYVLTAKIKLKMMDLTILKSYLCPFIFYQKLKEIFYLIHYMNLFKVY